LTLRAQGGGSAEATFSTDKQYFTVNSAVGENNQQVHPRFLHTNFAGINYNPPVVIIDSAVETGGPTLYKLEVVSSNLPTGVTIADIPYQTKADFKESISNGMVPQNVSDSFIETLQYGSNFEVQFKLTRRLGNGTEAEIEFNKLTYEFITPPQVFEFKSVTPNVRLSTNTITYEHSTQNLITANVPGTTTLLAEDPLQRYFFGYVKKDTGTNEFYGEDIGSKLKSLTFLEISQDNFTINEISETATIKYNPFDDPTRDVTSTATYSTFAPNSFSTTEVSKAKHTCIDKFGLKTNLTIDYSEISMKYSNSFQVVTDPDAPVFAHHIGDNTGAYTLTPNDLIFPETEDSDRIGHNNFVKVSHNWMSLDEIGANIYGLNNLQQGVPRSVRGTEWLNSRPEYKVGSLYYKDESTLYSEPVGFKRVIQDNTGIRAELRMRFVGQNGVLIDDTVTFQGPTHNFTGLHTGGLSAYPGIKSGQISPAVSLGLITDIAPAISNGKLFISHRMSGTDERSGFPVIMLTKDGGVNFADTEKNIDFARSTDEWFDEIPFQDKWGSITDDVKVTYDYVENSQNQILLVRSYNHPSTDTIYNEAVLVEIDDFSRITLKKQFRIVHKFRETISTTKTFDSFVHGVPSSYNHIIPDRFSTSSTDYNRWARRYFADNVPRITLFNEHFILPTGSAIMKRTNSYEFTTLEEILGVDIRSKAIDQYIVLPNNKLAYVSIREGMIDDGLGNINIRLDSNQFDHVYITNDALNPFDFFGIMTKIPDMSIGSTPRPTYSRKMFMFKALGKL
jgi:hypothetical protein